MPRNRSNRAVKAKRSRNTAGKRHKIVGSSDGKSGRSHSNNLIIIVPALVLGTGMVWLVMAVVFGGLGGHKFSLISRLEFLDTSKLSYYESHEAMLEAQKAYRKRKKELEELAYNEAYGKGTGVSYYSGAKTGRLIYEEEAKLMALIGKS